jgi:hypothetical protein
MQIREITQRLNENALGAFASGFAQGAGINVPDTGADSGASGSKYGPAAQQQAARLAEPLIAQQAKEEMTLWNSSILDLLKQKNVTNVAQLDQAAKQSLARSLVNQFYTNFTQKKLGTDYKSLPKLVDPKKQADAQQIVNKIQQSLNSVLNFNAPAKDKQSQLAQWTELSRAAYDAMSLIQFHPSKETALATEIPQVTQDTSGSYFFAGKKLDPNDPVDAKIIQKINAQRVPSAGATA